MPSDDELAEARANLAGRVYPSDETNVDDPDQLGRDIRILLTATEPPARSEEALAQRDTMHQGREDLRFELQRLRAAAAELSSALHGYADENCISEDQRRLGDREIEWLNALYALDAALSDPTPQPRGDSGEVRAAKLDAEQRVCERILEAADKEQWGFGAGDRMRSVIEAFLTTIKQARELPCTCEATGECEVAMSGPTCMDPKCPPCQHPEDERDPDCPIHGERTPFDPPSTQSREAE